MKERLTEWECSRIANNLDRMDDYRAGSSDTMYIEGTDMTESLSEWDALQVANNLDRINSYRRGNGILADSQTFIGMVVGLPISIITVIYFIWYIFC